VNSGRGGAPAVNPSMNGRNPMNNARSIVPVIPVGIDSNLDALYQLAEGTGGFVIVNSNDLLGGMEKIAREQDQYYILGYSPADSAEGSCHTLRAAGTATSARWTCWLESRRKPSSKPSPPA
jgi:hypothetical protein